MRNTLHNMLYNKATPQPDGCITWDLFLNKDGYGTVTYKGKTRYVHRLIWSLFHNQPIPERSCVCHTCDCRSCVNPDHLVLGTHSENIRGNPDKGLKPRGQWHYKAKGL